MKWETTVSQWNSSDPWDQNKKDEHVIMLALLHLVVWHQQPPAFFDHATQPMTVGLPFVEERACMEHRACVSKFEKERFDRRDSSHPSIRSTCESGFVIDDV